MLKIGDFSKLSRITVRMLRHYDEIDLIKPQSVDEWTGYRYYGESQLLEANKITLLKSLGFSLTEIKDFLKASNGSDTIAKLLKAKEKELTAQKDSICERLMLIEGVLNKLKQGDSFMNYVVNLEKMPELYVASVRKVIPEYSDEGTLWTILTKELEKQNCKPTVPCYPMAIYHDKGFVEKNVDVEIRFSVEGKYSDTEDVKFKTVPEMQVASCVFKGNYHQIGDVNRAIAEWVNANGYEFSGGFFSIYHKSPYDTKDPDEFVTQTCFPVKKK